MAKIAVEYLQELLFGEKRCSTMSKVVELINEKASEGDGKNSNNKVECPMCGTKFDNELDATTK